MQAVRVHPLGTSSVQQWSAKNPAPFWALSLDTIPIPTLTSPGQLLIRVHASTVTRDELTWPETYSTELPILGHDLAGTVEAVQGDTEGLGKNSETDCKPGDEVYGMLDMSRGSTWAQFAVARHDQIALKPKSLSWAESAAVPVSGLTAWQALFVKAGVSPPDFESIAEQGDGPHGRAEHPSRLLVTGAAGAVGLYLVQLGALAGLHVVAATSSKSRDEDFLKSLGASEVIEYEELAPAVPAQYGIVVDTVGGSVLEQCWTVVEDDGVLISIESANSNFVQNHSQQPFAKGKDKVKAIFFIVEPSRNNLERLSEALNLGLLKVFVAEEIPIQSASAAYELANKHLLRRGKVVLTI
jgi:NADPH:quinone reductase-like Zn-dependent oxidoreductase